MGEGVWHGKPVVAGQDCAPRVDRGGVDVETTGDQKIGGGLPIGIGRAGPDGRDLRGLAGGGVIAQTCVGQRLAVVDVLLAEVRHGAGDEISVPERAVQVPWNVIEWAGKRRLSGAGDL